MKPAPVALPASPALLKTKQAAELLNTSPSQVRAWVYSGDIECIRLSPRVVRIPRRAVELFIARAQAS